MYIPCKYVISINMSFLLFWSQRTNMSSFFNMVNCNIQSDPIFVSENLRGDRNRAVDFKIQSFFKSESNDSICLKSHDKIIGA